MTRSHDAIGTIAVLLLTGCIGAGLAWIGRGYWLSSRTTREGTAATAVVERLYFTGPYLVGRFFAAVSFEDAAGRRHVAELLLPSAQWNRLREGQPISILYASADPQCVTLGGRRMRAVSEAAGAIFVALGVLIALTAAWLLLGEVFGWGALR